MSIQQFEHDGFNNPKEVEVAQRMSAQHTPGTRGKELTTDAGELRARFEALASDPSYNFKRSRKGTYVNGAVARDWKWFQLGAKATGSAA